MAEIQLSVGSTIALPKAGLEKLLANLLKMGYRVLGPQIQDGAIVYKPLNNIAELPKGYISEQDAAYYRLVYSGHEAYLRSPRVPIVEAILFSFLLRASQL